MQQSPRNSDTVALRACMKGVRSAPEGRKNVAQGPSPGFGSRLVRKGVRMIFAPAGRGDKGVRTPTEVGHGAKKIFLTPFLSHRI